MVQLPFKRKRPTPARQRPASSPNRPRPYSYYASLQDERRTKTAETVVDLGSVGRRLRLIPTVVALLVIFGSVLFSLTLSSLPSVSMLEGETALYRSLDDYASAAEVLLDDNLKNRTKLTIDTAAVEQTLLEQFPELDAAVLRLPVLGRRPSLIISVSQPVLLLLSPAKSYVLNQSGVAVSEASQLAAKAKDGLPVVRDQSGLEVTLGEQALTTETIRFILASSLQLEAQKLKVSELILPARVSQLDIRLEGVRYYVKTDTAGDARLQIGSFLAVREELAGQGITPAEYIDVRVEEKVFYK